MQPWGRGARRNRKKVPRNATVGTRNQKNYENAEKNQAAEYHPQPFSFVKNLCREMHCLTLSVTRVKLCLAAVRF